ncbi:unnamed protein product, partial [Effrenium voratum]
EQPGGVLPEIPALPGSRQGGFALGRRGDGGHLAPRHRVSEVRGCHRLCQRRRRSRRRWRWGGLRVGDHRPLATSRSSWPRFLRQEHFGLRLGGQVAAWCGG